MSRFSNFPPKAAPHRASLVRGTAERSADTVAVREKGEKAHALLQNDVFGEVIGDLIQSAREAYENSPIGPTGATARDTAHAELRGLNSILEKLEGMADNAKLYDKMEQNGPVGGVDTLN